MSSPSKASALRTFIVAWCVVLALGAAFRPLQMDEVFQLVGIDTPHLASVFGWLRVNPASVPVGYLLQWALVRVAGASNLVSRLPSLAAWVMAVVAMMRIGDRIGLRSVETLVVLTAVTPMLFRYAMEGRPYLPAFCLTAFATLLLVEFIRKPEQRPTLWRLSLYGASLTLAPLVQGTAITVTLAHALFVLTDSIVRRNRARQMLFGATIVMSLLLPVAWSLAMRDGWTAAISRNGYTFTLNVRTAYGFIKDVTGGGIVCSALLFLAAGLACTRTSIPGSIRYLLGLTVLVTICGAVASDAVAGYFISPRQAIYCLCALIVLAAGGWEFVRSKYPAAALVMLGVFAATAIAADVSVVRSKEDWKAASRMVAGAVEGGFCIQPASDVNAPIQLYSFFDPPLGKRRCVSSDRKVALVYSTYTPRADRDLAASSLTRRGFVAAGTQTLSGSTVERFILRREAN